MLKECAQGAKTGQQLQLKLYCTFQITEKRASGQKRKNAYFHVVIVASTLASDLGAVKSEIVIGQTVMRRQWDAIKDVCIFSPELPLKTRVESQNYLETLPE